jgi:hypothetical protein
MKNALLTFLAVAAAFVLNPGSAEGHHGYAAFDQKVVVTLKGTVTDFQFVNPHSVVEFEVKDDKGQVENWKAELPSRSALSPRGWTAISLKPGDELTISGYRAKNGSPSMWVTKILSNGQELKLSHEN